MKSKIHRIPMENNTHEIYHSDHLGSSSYITDNFGRPSHYYEYLPFGELLTEHNQSKYYIDPYPTQNMSEYNNPYKFNAKEMDKETGMYYYGARYYDPRISIFVSVDPLAEEFPNYGGYVYTMNNPINLVDPTGMAPEKIVPRNMTQEQLKTFNKNIKKLKKDSFMFRELYNMLEASPNNHYISIDPDSPNVGAVENLGNGESSLVLSSISQTGVNYIMNEELFHMFQIDSGGDDSELNWEFEAKTFTMISTRDYRFDNGVGASWGKELESNFGSFNKNKGGKKFLNKLTDIFSNDVFKSKYKSEAKTFSGYYLLIDKNESPYTRDTKSDPVNLLNFINNIGEK